MNWQRAQHKEENLYNIPGDWLRMEYFEALNILFRVENSLRVFVYIVLKNEMLDKWKDLSITSDDAESSTLGAIAKKRLAQDKNYAYLGYSLNSPLLYLTSGELIRVITSESYWKIFKNYFLGSKEIIKNKLDEIGNVRNSLAHFRPIKEGDIELIKQNSLHTLLQIEQTLNDFITCPDVVPTNTEEHWYTELITLGTEECKITMRQSKTEEWVKLIFSFDAPILKIVQPIVSFTVTTINLKTDSILLQFPNITKYAICATETIPKVYTETTEELSFVKQVRFTFSRSSIKKNYATIKSDLEKLLIDISKEVALVKEDNLARGKLVEIAKCRFVKKSSSRYYSFDGQPFKTEFNKDSPVEFWGSFNSSSEDFITDTDKYPWMPVNVSEDKSLPF